MMPEFGFPAQPRQAAIKSLVANLRTRSDESRSAAVTGRHSDVTGELGGRVSELMQMEKSIRDVQTYAEAITLSEGRAATSQRALDQVRASAQEITDTADLLGTNGTSADFGTLSTQARGQLESLVAGMNTSFAGRMLFAGDVVDTAPVADAETIMSASVPFLEGNASAGTAYAALRAEFLGAGATFETALYNGGTDNAPVTEIAPGERVDFSVRADEGPMREMLFNMTVMAAAFDDSNAIDGAAREGLLKLASEGLRNNIGSIAQVQGRVGTAEARIATMKSRNIASEASLTISINELAGADTFEAAITLRDLETQLEVAFSTTSRLANLTLANFR
ncbi:MAG: hypothetical protein AB8B85_23220 [Paracoccaceae bacterium]